MERNNRTIVGKFGTYVEDHKDRGDDLVSTLSLAYNRRPQLRPGVAPLVLDYRSSSATCPWTAWWSTRQARQPTRARVVSARSSGSAYEPTSSRCGSHERRGQGVRRRPRQNQAERRNPRRATPQGPHPRLGEISLGIGGYPETSSSDNVRAALKPVGDIHHFHRDHWAPHIVVVSDGHRHTGRELV